MSFSDRVRGVASVASTFRRDPARLRRVVCGAQPSIAEGVDAFVRDDYQLVDQSRLLGG